MKSYTFIYYPKSGDKVTYSWMSPECEGVFQAMTAFSNHLWLSGDLKTSEVGVSAILEWPDIPSSKNESNPRTV